MSSIIEGYNYDIFISYRQKDNKHDGWVTEFVNNLKGELESTFKEEISVYFDINPHDGLLETHDVDASLKDKLKCLVFIPIISRTYCDPKSFAWVHEFKAFIEQASGDQYGLKVKLPSGNVANRVLPVQIHDLDTDDKKMVESELGGFLRGIEFIYKEPGVNRPLMADEDNPDNNLNKTFYRNQINKVANAIKETITAIKQYSPQPVEVQKAAFKEVSLSRKADKTKLYAGFVIAIVLIILGFLFIPKLIKPKEQVEKSIAVLPFKLLSDEPDNQYLADGMMEEVTLHLSKIKDLRVLGRTSTEQYRNPTKTLTAIGKDLDVGYLLEGSFQKFSDSVRLIVQLIKTGKEGHVWANSYDRLWKNIFSMQSEVAQSVAMELMAAVTPEEKVLIDKIPTTNLTAYDFYRRGRDEHWKYQSDNNNKEALERAEDLYHKALENDSTYAQAYTGLAQVYWNKHYWETYFKENFLDSVLILADIALSYDDQISEAYTSKANYYSEMGNRDQAIKELDKAIKYNPNDWMVYYAKGELYFNYDIVKSIDNYDKAVSLHRGEQLPLLLRTTSSAYLNAGFTEKSIYYSLEALKLDGDSLAYYNRLITCEFHSGNFERAHELREKVYAMDSTNTGNLFQFAIDYMFLNQPEEVLKYFKRWLESTKALSQLVVLGRHRIGWAYWQNGYREEAEYYFNEQINYCNKVIEMGRVLSLSYREYYDLAAVYAFKGDKNKAIENLKIFNKLQMIPAWMMPYIRYDPLLDGIRHEPEFQQIVGDIEAKFQAEHERVRKWLEKQGMH